MKPVVSIVEDSVAFQQALAQVLRESQDFQLGKIYGSAEEAIEALQKNSAPDIIVADIQLPGRSGIELISWVRDKGLSVLFLVCSIHDDDDKIMQALEAGAEGYILKDSSAEQIRSALHELMIGGAPMSPYIARKVISFFRKPKLAQPTSALTTREEEVLKLLATGLQYKQIAEEIHVSIETVKTHLRNVYFKLHVQNKAEAVRKYKRGDI